MCQTNEGMGSINPSADREILQHQRSQELSHRQGLTPLGISKNRVWHEDPRRLMIVMSRYKFVAKMLSGKKRVLEIGCGDAFCTRIVLQEVEEICAIDFDSMLVEDANKRMEEKWTFDCRVHDMVSGPVDGTFDAAYAVDVIEHILPENEHEFMANIVTSLDDNGVLILGAPSIQSQVYASRDSKEAHVNCKDDNELKNLTLQYFDNVFIFSMNDEVVHTGFYPMAHYLWALCVTPRNRSR